MKWLIEMAWLVGCIFVALLNTGLAAKGVDIITTGGLVPLQEEEILRFFTQNKTDSNNYTFVELIGNLGNLSGTEQWQRTYETTNPDYGLY